MCPPDGSNACCSVVGVLATGPGYPPGEVALVDLYRQPGNLSEAVRYYWQALTVREKRWQLDTWLGRREALVQTCWSLGQALEHLGRPEEALAAYLRAVGPRRVTPKEGKAQERRQLSELYRNRVPIARRHGRPAEAEMLVLQARTLWTNGPTRNCLRHATAAGRTES
jgi:tetratricopeptide (TPR) repeat protein